MTVDTGTFLFIVHIDINHHCSCHKNILLQKKEIKGGKEKDVLAEKNIFIQTSTFEVEIKQPRCGDFLYAPASLEPCWVGGQCHWAWRRVLGQSVHLQVLHQSIYVFIHSHTV